MCFLFFIFFISSGIQAWSTWMSALSACFQGIGENHPSSMTALPPCACRLVRPYRIVCLPALVLYLVLDRFIHSWLSRSPICPMNYIHPNNLPKRINPQPPNCKRTDQPGTRHHNLVNRPRISCRYRPDNGRCQTVRLSLATVASEAADATRAATDVISERAEAICTAIDPTSEAIEATRVALDVTSDARETNMHLLPLPWKLLHPRPPNE